uniref:Cytochrome P450 n=1 Tax=Pectinophora gossypiella TaxID=13191 RepID=A0A1E1WM70_PECGO
MFFYLLLVVIVLLAFICLHLRFSRWGRLMAKIPGNKSYPIIGDSIDIIKLDAVSSFVYFRNLCKDYGRISKMQMIGSAAVNLAHHEDIEIILSSTRFNEKQTPYNFMKPWLGDGLLISNGEKWKQRRKLLTPAFHFNILKKFCHTFNEHTERFLELLDKETSQEKTNVKPLLTRATLDIMCETSMGTSMHETSGSTTKKYFDALYDIGDVLLERFFKVWLHSDFIYNYSSLAKRERKLLKDLHNFTNTVIDERREYRQKHNITSTTGDEMFSGKVKKAMLDLLLENEGTKIDSEGIREEVDTFMFEGHDTTSMAMSFMIMRIANEPEIQDKIYKELQGVFGDSREPPTVEELSELKYLECCIKESLRIYPSVPFIARYITEDAELGGYTVPAGTIVQIDIFDCHRNPEIWPEPEKFIPERFLPENCVGRHSYAYIPFSAGARNCIGQKFAMLEMKTMMSCLLRRFKLEPVTTHEDIVFYADLVLRTKNPIYVKFRPRTKTMYK